ncbi:MAG: thiamine diphosphokinase [Clostridiales bacterium]|nr:thiamine diphosphokinase [Clostridiales bacterium]MDO4350255.1 thiamine diphosphokinase [Eubacteriales bacterium]MDY4009117.1 thiamine diphosphokinase [Candidatus Limiplasma sp.]
MCICYIVGAGDFAPRGFSPGPEDLIIAADGGLRPLLAMGVTPNLLLGDLDSLGDFPLPPGLPMERHPVQKDDTDTGLALTRGWELGYRRFALYGGSGGRIGHLLANLQSMCRLSRMGASLRLAARDYDAYALTNGTLTLPPLPKGTLVSVFCNGDRALGVTLRGLLYPLSEHTLTCDFPLGVSNQVLQDGVPAQITVRQGTLLVFHAAQNPPCHSV